MSFQASHYQRITRAILDEPWAILPSKLEAIAEFIALKASGGSLSDAEIKAIQAAAPTGDRRAGVVAVLPVIGTLSRRMNMMSALSGGTSVEDLSRKFANLVEDTDVSAIILQLDSPGGAVSGIPEFAAQINRATARKPIVAVADSLAASAAYWLGAAASEFVASPSAEVGSVGVLMMHIDESGADEKDGFKVSFIHAGKYKVEGNPHEPLSDEARAYAQSRVDEVYAQFTGDLARFRDVPVSEARGERFGEGRVLSAQRALKAGMVDRIATLDETIERLMTPQGRSAVMRRQAVAEDWRQTAEAMEVTIREFAKAEDVSALTARVEALEARLAAQEEQQAETDVEIVKAVAGVIAGQF